jgi:hypothetical protein
LSAGVLFNSFIIEPDPNSDPRREPPPLNDPPQPAAQEKLMALSDTAAREIAKALRKHVDMKALEQVVTELVEIPGDKDFRDSIERLVHALRMVSNR